MAKDTTPAPYFRFTLGDIEAIIVSDGKVLSGKPSATHPRPDGEVDRFLRQSHLPLDKLVFAANVLLVRHAGRLIIFDAGLGPLKEKPAWGANAGRLLENMQIAQIDPKSVDDVVLTHGHGEHIAGLTAQDGTLHFPNANIHINRTEYEFWTDPVRTGLKWAFDHEQAVRSLAKQKERLRYISDGEEFLPGITAMSTPGHTVAHMSFMLTSGDSRLCVLGDMARHYIINVERPDWQFIGDADRELTVRTRRRLLERAAAERFAVMSYHFPWPGIGHIGRSGSTFRYYPIELDTTRRVAL